MTNHMQYRFRPRCFQPLHTLPRAGRQVLAFDGARCFVHAALLVLVCCLWGDWGFLPCWKDVLLTSPTLIMSLWRSQRCHLGGSLAEVNIQYIHLVYIPPKVFYQFWKLKILNRKVQLQIRGVYHPRVSPTPGPLGDFWCLGSGGSREQQEAGMWRVECIYINLPTGYVTQWAWW